MKSLSQAILLVQMGETQSSQHGRREKAETPAVGGHVPTTESVLKDYYPAGTMEASNAVQSLLFQWHLSLFPSPVVSMCQWVRRRRQFFHTLADAYSGQVVH